ncbi:MAG: PAS domain S-box protein [Deltaproteobacteria bacterium]|nr:PAS domain S-box protein [Deltaproteobacteria bacterium]
MLASLEKSKEKFRVLFEFAPDAYYLSDLQGVLVDGNRTAEELLGYKKEELIGKNFSEMNLLPPDQLPKVLELLGRNLEGKETGPDELILNNKRGESIAVEIRTLPAEIDGKNIVLGIARDITERKRLETSLHKAQKMEAIGTLAGGVAHDLNNILGGLVSYPELLLLQLPEDSPLRKSILTIQKSGEKAAAVVQDLLTLARRGVVVTEVVNLNDVTSEYLKSPEYEKFRSYHPGVHIETHLEKNVLNILGSSIHLSKTVMNLVSNAAEAMAEGGKLSISTENRYIDRPIGGYDNVKEGDYVVFSVSDSGTGIAPDDMEKIFEPFYTKKKMGRSGTGLGMTVVWGTVKDHDGYIDVRSTEGKGTTFTLYFPVTRKSPEERSEISLKDYRGKGETILVADDVEEQRKIASGMLKELGYSVVSVSSGEEAVEYLKSRKVDLLVLDMIMDPGLDGLETYKKIIEIHPGQKAIIASGFSETDRVKALHSLGAGAYIRKPFLLEKIGLAVKEELETGAVL